MTQKTLPFSMRLDPAMKAELMKLAEAEGRSLTNYIEHLLRQHIALQTRRPAITTKAQ
jgi:hypothetical protein